MERQKIKAVQDLIKSSKSRRRKKRSSTSKDRYSDCVTPLKSRDKDLSRFLPGIGDFSSGLCQSRLGRRENHSQNSGANKYLVPLSLKNGDKPKSERRKKTHSRHRLSSREHIEETRIQYREYSCIEKHSSSGTDEYSSKMTIQSARSKKVFFTQGRDDSCDDDDVYSSDTYSDVDEVDDEDIEEIKEETEIFKKGFWRYPKTGKPGLDRFRRAVDFVLISRQIFKCTQTTLTHEESVLFFVDLPTTSEYKTSVSKPGATFDISAYKNLKEQNMFKNLQNVLDQPGYCRTEEQILTTMHLLQNYSSFASYPNHVQTKICQKAWLSRFEASRVICREGQATEYMYMILVGVAVSRTKETIKNGHENTCVLRKGDVIGEEEILEGKPRGSTIISKEPLQVLGLDKDDVIDIFMTATNSDSLAFLKQIPQLSLFPVDQLADQSFSCSRFYKNGSIIVANSEEFKHVYVVTSGSCQLLKAIKCQSDALPKSTRKGRKPSEDLILPPIVIRRQSDASQHLSKRKSFSEGPIQFPPIYAGDGRGIIHRRNSQNRQLETQIQRKTKKRASICSRRSSNESVLSSSEVAIGDGELGAFARLGTLCRRSIFGLQRLVYTDTPNFALVSNGCECIQISREFFEKHLDSVLVAKLKTKLSPYPSLAQLQSTLEDQVTWEDYKEQMYNKDSHES